MQIKPVQVLFKAASSSSRSALYRDTARALYTGRCAGASMYGTASATPSMLQPAALVFSPWITAARRGVILRGIPSILTPDLLKILAQMGMPMIPRDATRLTAMVWQFVLTIEFRRSHAGHGDELVVADANFPAYSTHPNGAYVKFVYSHTGCASDQHVVDSVIRC